MKLTFKTLFLLLVLTQQLAAQGLKDGVFMDKGVLCGGIMYSHDQWKNYWEGTLNRENFNIGNVTTQSVAAMLTYGITDDWNIMASAPYVFTKASAGTLHGMRGFQDATFATKYRITNNHVSGGNFSSSVAVGGSLPMSNYVADFLPLSIGLQSKTAFAQAMLHYVHKSGLTGAIYGGYTWRSNVTIDRTSYYTTELVNSNEVAMPAMYNAGARFGYYSYRWALEATVERNACLSGFDIRRNDMPFLSNQMEATRLGVTGSYRVKALANTQLVAGLQYCVAGRNVGQSLTWNVGVMQAINFFPNPSNQ